MIPPKSLSIELQSTRDSINRATALIVSMFEKVDIPDKIMFDIKLAIHEAVVNAIEHGNQYDPNKRVHISCDTTCDCFKMVIRDEGAGFNPSAVPDPTLPENLLKENGRGIFLMKNLCDEVSYNDKGNEVHIIKRLKRTG